MKGIKTTIFVVALSVAVFFVARSFSAVPSHEMWVSSGDKNGIATLYTDRFSVSFEGHSFSSYKSSGLYMVGGRSGGPRIPWLDDTESIEQSDSVEYGYSENHRIFTLKFRGHKVEYSHHLNSLKVDGQEFSIAAEPIHVLVKKNGQIKQTAS